MDAEEPLLSVLVVNIDYKLHLDRSQFNGTKRKFGGQQAQPVYVPTIRVFGSTDAGQRACTHIHGVFPCVYFRPENLHHASFESLPRVQSMLPGLQAALEELLRNFKSLTYKPAEPRNKESLYSKRRRVHSLEVVSRKTIYGMYIEEFLFVKVVLFDPGDIKRVASILEEGALRGVSMQAYEAHIPYLLQFTSTYNLPPMGWMHIRTAKFRAPLPPDPEPRALQIPPAPAGGELVAQASTAAHPPSTPLAAPLDTVESPIFSHIKYRGSRPETALPTREESVQSGSSADAFGALTEPHTLLTQHQCAQFLSPPLLPVGIAGSTQTSVASQSAPADQRSADSAGAGNIFAGPGAARLYGKLLTQSTIPANLVWSGPSASLPTSAPAADAALEGPPNTVPSGLVLHEDAASALSAEELAEVERLLQGLSERDLMASPRTPTGTQPELASPIPGSVAAAADSSRLPVGADRTLNAFEKDSNCELELDIQAADILNQHLPKSDFGAELWEEERLRCKAKGLVMDAAPTPPSTQTRHRTPQPTEVQFQQRLASLQRKGRALREASSRASKAASVPRAVLSQFQAPGVTAESAQKPGGGPRQAALSEEVHTAASQWASQRIYAAQQQVQLDESVQGMFSADSADIAEEYVKSQFRSTQDSGCGEETVSDPGALCRGVLEDDDEALLQEESQECDDILQSTQVNLENMHELSGRSSHRASILSAMHGASEPIIPLAAPMEVEDMFAELQQQDTASASKTSAAKVPTPGSGSAQRPPLHPGSRLFATPRQDSNEKQAWSGSGGGSADAHALASRWSALGGQPGSATPPSPQMLPSPGSAHASPSGPYTQHSPESSSGLQDRSATVNAREDSPLIHTSPSVSSPAASVESTAKVSTSASIGALYSSGGSDSGTKSISSVFRKRKRLSTGTGAKISFALFPEVIPDNQPATSDTASSVPGGVSLAVPEAGLEGAAGDVTKSAPVDDALGPVKKKVKRSVSFREAEEVIPRVDDSSPIPGEIGATPVDLIASQHGAVPDKPPKVSMLKMVGSVAAMKSSQDSASAIQPRPPVDWRALRTVALRPTFHPPTAAELSDLATYGLPDVCNIPAHYSDPADLLPVGSGNGSNAAAASYLAQLHRLKSKNDCGAFDGGFPSSQDVPRVTVSRPRLPPRMRCLLPTFLPPSPARLRQQIASSVSGSALKEAPTEGQDVSQIRTPTQTPFTAAPPAAASNVQTIGAGAETGKRMTRLTVMSIEVHCNTRQDFLPNPKLDAVQAVFWAVDDQIGNAESESVRRLTGVICQLQRPLSGKVYQNARQQPPAAGSNTTGAALVTTANPSPDAELTHVQQQMRLLIACGLPADAFIEIVTSEVELFQLLTRRVSTMDPDFLTGYEVESQSVGYLVKRGFVLQLNMLQMLSRMPQERPSYRNGSMPTFPAAGEVENEAALPAEEDGKDDKSELASDMTITGRIILNAWRLMREELKLFNYTYSNVAANLLSVRVPYFTHAQLTRWFQAPTTRHRTVRHLHQLSVLNLQLLDKIDHVRRTAECARLYGIDYNSVLSRGSQYRVEASLLRKVRALGYLLLSPSRKAVASQAPMGVIPLVMEPRSQFYSDPVVVLDFQSLYPSMMLAYNLCFSTIMGKLRPGEVQASTPTRDGAGSAGAEAENDTTERLGTISYAETTAALNATLHTDLNSSNYDPVQISGKDAYLAPNGSVFCAKSVRLGILPRMVQEMLDTRVMVKRAMKRHKSSTAAGAGARDVLQKVLDARQLAIKLLSNVTYGYASAGYSGRMPMAELADAIVQSGRSTLEWTIRCIHAHPEWRGHVVYGDTDSVFVHLPGRTREDAFRIGQEISDFITAKSPPEVVLKFEKVYFPSVLVTKKRYVGYMYETLAQKRAHFEAKGIEVVRRDQCPATVKMQEKVLRILFETRNMSQVKQYVASEWNKMMQGGDKLLLKDFIFSKEVRFGHYASVSSQPPGAVVASKAVLRDECAVPPYNWRVPYVVVHGIPNAPLKNLVYSPEEIMRRGSELRLNYVYYMVKCINPALDRVLSMCGGEVFQWFKSLSRPKLRLRHINYDAYASTDKTSGGGTVVAFPTGLGADLRGKASKHKQTSMDQFTKQGSCEICQQDAQPQKTLCASCAEDPQMALCVVMGRMRLVAEKERVLSKICQNCTKTSQASVLFARGEIVGLDCCESLDCPVFFERARLVTRLEDVQTAAREIEDSSSHGVHSW